MPEVDDSAEVDAEEPRSVLSVLHANFRDEKLSPPVATPVNLPSHELSPPMFERLVAEVALSVDGLSSIRIYGRSGQSQGGLDLIGWRSDGLSVYQVRRIKELTPSALRKAVTDFAGPVDKKAGAKKARRFDAQRFVLVTGCPVDDRTVDDELDKLKREYAGDLEIELYDKARISMELRYRGPLVYGIFGPDWARAYCGYEPAATGAPTPHGRAYLADPVDILGYSDIFSRAQDLATSEPAAAAELFNELASELASSGFTPRSRELRASQLSAYRQAGDTAKALTIAIDMAMADYIDGDLFPGSEYIRLAVELAGAHAESLSCVLEASARWFEAGYEVEPVIKSLSTLLEGNVPRATALLLVISEQVVADDDPRDDAQQLLQLVETWLPKTSGLENVRLACGASDLRVRLGLATPDEAYREIARRASGGYIGSDQAALVHRRRGRALAAERPSEAIDSYRRAVIDASDCGLGGDVRDALRSIAFLADIGDGVQPMAAARSVSNRKRLLDGVEQIVIGALESLVDDKLPQALRASHDWSRREQVNGALMDEIIARRRLGEVYSRADEKQLAVRSLILGGAWKSAQRTAGDIGRKNYFDIRPYLETRHLRDVQAAAASSIVQLADLVPDEDVESVCNRLLQLTSDIGNKRLFDSSPSTHALEALAAFADRLPATLASGLLDELNSLVERDKNTYRHCDEAMLAFFEACALYMPPDVAERAIAELVRCVEQNIDKTERHLRRIGKSEAAIELLTPLAESGHALAIELLATWDCVTDAVRRDAIQSAQPILDRPVGRARSSWAVGAGAQISAVKLRAALKSDVDDANLIELRDDLLRHLLNLAEDSFDVAESRSDAVHAIRILSGVLSADGRVEALRRLLALHDDPQLSAVDHMHQDSLAPLSRFRFNTGSEYFHLDCLFAASVLADAHDEWEQVWRRVAKGISDPALTATAANILSKAIRCLTDTRVPPIAGFAGHPISFLRQVAVVCWTEDPDRDPSYASVFADDDDRAVRANIAYTLRKLNTETEPYAGVLEGLLRDESWQVRRRASK